MSIGIAEIGMIGLILLVLLAGTIGIAILCWVWMKGSRASQERMEERNEEIVSLLRDQNRHLEALAHGLTERERDTTPPT